MHAVCSLLFLINRVILVVAAAPVAQLAPKEPVSECVCCGIVRLPASLQQVGNLHNHRTRHTGSGKPNYSTFH